MIGTSVDRYEILEELGHGGMSVVYRGLDSSLEREVAVKVLHNHLAKKLENRRRFHREAKAIARLRHPNILEIYDFSSEDADRSFIVMEYVAGENLRQFVARTGAPPPEVAALAGVEICNALEHAHDHGIIHRDLKPENVMVSSAGDLKLMDFGIAHVIDAETMTATGSLMGSPAHMAPEIIDGQKVDVRADVFALGTVLYWLATGNLPFDGANAPQVLKKVLAGDYDQADVAEPKVGRRLSEIIACCLSHDPDDRYSSVTGVRKELQEFAASMGLSDGRLELKKYFRDPDAYRETFDGFVVERLSRLARQAERERDVPGAIALFNRILAYDPANTEVQRLLDRLCRRDRWRRYAPRVALGVVTLACIIAWVATRPPPVVEPPPSESPGPGADVLATDTAAVVADGASRVVEARVALLEQTFEQATKIVRDGAFAAELLTTNREPLQPIKLTDPIRGVLAPAPDMGTADAGAPPPEVVKHIWRFSVTPPAATFMIDGKPVDTFRARAGIELAEGMHSLAARGKGTRPWSQHLRVTGPGTLPVVLEWESGRVEVRSNVDTLVWFDGADDPTSIGRRGFFRVPFGPADSTESSREITLRAAFVDDAAYAKSQTQKVAVTPGNTAIANFTFAPDP